MTVTFERNMGNGVTLFIGALILRDTDAAARAVALALASHGGGIVVARDTHGRLVASAQGMTDEPCVVSPYEPGNQCARCGDPMGSEGSPSELYDGRVCLECALLE